MFPKFSGQEFENFIAVAEKLRSDYGFGHTLDAKHLPSGDSSVTGPLVRLFKPFDELFVDFQVLQYFSAMMRLCLCLYHSFSLFFMAI